MVYLCGMVCAHEKNLFKSRKHTCLRLLVAPLYLFLAFELVDQRRMTAASLRPDQNQMMSWWSHLTSNEDGLTAITWLTMTSVVFAVLVAISQIFVAFALERMTRSQYVRWLAAEEARQAERKALKSQASSRGKNGQYKAVGSSATNNEHIGIGVGGSMTRSPTGSSKNDEQCHHHTAVFCRPKTKCNAGAHAAETEESSRTSACYPVNHLASRVEGDVDCNELLASKYERPGLTEDEIDEIREAFNLFDTTGSGTIDPKELKHAMQSLGFDSKNPTVFQMIQELDRDMSGMIEFEQFLDAITSKLGDKVKEGVNPYLSGHCSGGAGHDETREGISKIFALFDDDKTGAISSKNLKRVAKELGETMSEEELREMIERADSMGNGEISVEDFYTIMTKKTFP
eukprot:g1621.t1